MSTFDQVREGLGRFWDSVSEGWRHLSERASHALTRFTPLHKGGDVITADERVVREASRWGLLVADIREDDDAITVKLEAPGMEREDFDISVLGNTLVVRGEKRVQREETKGSYHRIECAYGAFERAVPLPVEVDEAKADAKYKRGVLRIRLPKSERARARRITVQTT